jgi:hypothetical protein
MEAVAVPVVAPAVPVPDGTLYMDVTRLRLAGNDPAIKNNALCFVELIGVSHIIGIDGPRTRTLIPRFLIKAWGIMNLEKPVQRRVGPVVEKVRDVPVAVPEEGRLHELQPFMTREQKLGSSMPTWRQHLAQQMHSEWAALYAPYDCLLTGRRELPVLAGENQLDIDADARHKAALVQMEEYRKQVAQLIAPDVEPEPFVRPYTPAQRAALAYFAHDKHLTVRNEGEYNAARMYTLSQVLTGVVEALDCERGLQHYHRLVINAAKKHAIASDGSLSYYMRKKRAVEHTRWLLQRQRDSPDVTAAERENGIRWLAFLDVTEAGDQKLDDLADAFLLSLETTMSIYKKWFKRLRLQGLVFEQPLCFRPVTNADIEAARAAGTLAVNVPLTEPEPVRPKYARKRKAAVALEGGEGAAEEATEKGTPQKRRKKTTKKVEKKKAASDSEESTEDLSPAKKQLLVAVKSAINDMMEM